ncbi:RNA methyltransferase [Paraburkholderia saeva]|uniref:hypothetical protein n=1 Tax=Paraburkholderia saeva TaxID=2777537 RepID=UPI001E38E55D|nr:hypothetical protein [Paraburkholderia saeva]
MNESGMLPNEEDAIAHLRSRGYVVVVRTPDVLRGADASAIGDIDIDRTSEPIGMLATEPLDEAPDGIMSATPSLPQTAQPGSHPAGPSSFLEALCLKFNWPGATANVPHYDLSKRNPSRAKTGWR